MSTEWKELMLLNEQFITRQQLAQEQELRILVWEPYSRLQEQLTPYKCWMPWTGDINSNPLETSPLIFNSKICPYLLFIFYQIYFNRRSINNFSLSVFNNTYYEIMKVENFRKRLFCQKNWSADFLSSEFNKHVSVIIVNPHVNTILTPNVGFQGHQVKIHVVFTLVRSIVWLI